MTSDDTVQPVIAAAIIVQDGLVLMVRRRVREGALSWQFPAGAVEPGETDVQAAVRETKEETGVVVLASWRTSTWDGESIRPRDDSCPTSPAASSAGRPMSPTAKSWPKCAGVPAGSSPKMSRMACGSQFSTTWTRHSRGRLGSPAREAGLLRAHPSRRTRGSVLRVRLRATPSATTHESVTGIGEVTGDADAPLIALVPDGRVGKRRA